jgi:dynein heavy chain
VTTTAWDNLCILDKMPAFRGIVTQFDQRIREWYTNYFIVPEPETVPLIGEFDTSLDELQKMLLLRCLRPDRVVHAINSFVKNNLNTGLFNYTVPPGFDLKLALMDSSPTTPMIFIIS